MSVDPWTGPALDELVRYVGAQRSTGLRIVDHGRCVVERHWPLPDDADAAAFRAHFVHGTASDGTLLEDVASLQKSVVALLAAIAIDRGTLDPERAVSAYLGPGWSKASAPDEAAVSVRHLMEMNSGLSTRLVREAAPGTRFLYNTPAYAILKPVLEAAAGRSLDAITGAWLAGPVGLTDTGWRARPVGFVDNGNPTGLVMTARDIARLGQLVLDRGVASDGTRVVSARQLDALFARTGTNPAYGRLWWLNGSDETIDVGDDAPVRAGPYVAAAPVDLVAARGAQDRRLFVVPSRRLVVVRTGRAAPDPGFDEAIWARLDAAMR